VCFVTTKTTADKEKKRQSWASDNGRALGANTPMKRGMTHLLNQNSFKGVGSSRIGRLDDAKKGNGNDRMTSMGYMRKKAKGRKTHLMQRSIRGGDLQLERSLE